MYGRIREEGFCMDFVLNENHRDISDEDLLNDLKRVYAIVGKKSLSQSDYAIHGKYGTNTYHRRFGSWNKALQKCGYSPNHYQIAASKSGHIRQEIGDEELLSDVVRVSVLLGKKTISSKEYDRYGEFSRDSCFSHFKTWNNTLILAGLVPFTKIAGQKIEQEKLFAEIERVWISLGRQPTTTDIKNGCAEYSLNTYTRRFGSWRKALEAFVQWVNNNDEENIESQNTIDILSDEKNVPHYEVKPTPHVLEVPVHKTCRDINLRLRFQVMRRDNFKCCICGASPAKDSSVELHIDHIVPWAKGGETVIDNLQTLCSKCNLGKSDLSMNEK